MRVLVEDPADHDDSEPCVGIHKDVGEALTGEHADRVPNCEKLTIQGADAVEISGRQHELRQRLRRFRLELHLQKTRIIEFGRLAERKRKAQNLGKPETFAFSASHTSVEQAGRGLSNNCGRSSGRSKDDMTDDAAADRGAESTPNRLGDDDSSTTSGIN
jgi:hypothetical protein